MPVCSSAPAVLPSPGRLKARLPLSAALAADCECQRRAIAHIVHGRDPRLLVVVGPCSVHDPAAALDYASRLAALQQRCREHLLLVMRCYVEKPRTLLGWRGLINDPHLDGSHDIATGLDRARRLLLAVMGLGQPVAAEVLDPLIAPYLGDCLAWAALGARTVASQTHRELASALPLPIGCKNALDGDIEPALAAVQVSGHRHRFLGMDDAGRAVSALTAGNADAHLVLRGGTAGPNCSSRQVAVARRRLRKAGIERGLIIDCSHGNSGKDLVRQAALVRTLALRIEAGEAGIAGLMLESNLQSGRQELRSGRQELRSGRQELRVGGQLVYGQSITDACLGWKETEDLLLGLATASSRGRRS